MPQTFQHDPQSTEAYSVDLAGLTNGTGTSNWLASGEQISTAVWTVPAGLTLASQALQQTNTVAKAWISGGTLGITYTVIVKITTTASPARIQEFEIYLFVVDKSGNWTYSGNPSSSTLDEVRFLVGDTDVNNQKALDMEIRYAITKRGDPVAAAALVARAIAARFASAVDKSIGDLSISYSQQARQFESLAVRLEAGDVWGGVIPYAGGITRSDMERVRSNEDRVEPVFSRDQFDQIPTTKTEWDEDEV